MNDFSEREYRVIPADFVGGPGGPARHDHSRRLGDAYAMSVAKLIAGSICIAAAGIMLAMAIVAAGIIFAIQGLGQ